MPLVFLTPAPRDHAANSEMVEFICVRQILFPSPPRWPTNCLLHQRAAPEDHSQSWNGDVYHPAPLHAEGLYIAARTKAEGGPMLCRRCSGRRVRETFDDLREEVARICSARRCSNCGRIEYSVVRANRLRVPSGTTVDASRDVQEGKRLLPQHSG
jgi:hypothetical protein